MLQRTGLCPNMLYYVLYWYKQDVYIKSCFPSMDCITAIRPFMLIDQFKNLLRKQINTCHSCWAANHRWNATHILLCLWCSLLPPLLFPSMKQNIGLLLPMSYQFCRGCHFNLKNIFGLLLPTSCQFCRGWHSKKMLGINVLLIQPKTITC